jgi:hypothetical protein
VRREIPLASAASSTSALSAWTDAEQVREKLLGAVLGNGEVVDTWGIGLGERLDVPPRRGIDLSCRQGLVKRTPQPGPVSVCSVAPLPVVFSIAGSLPVVLLGTLFGAHTRGLLHEIGQPPLQHYLSQCLAPDVSEGRVDKDFADEPRLVEMLALVLQRFEVFPVSVRDREWSDGLAGGGMCTLHHLLACCRLRLPDVQDRNAICIGRIIGDADLLDLVPLIPEIVADVPCPSLAPQSPIIEMQTALEAAPAKDGLS